MLVYKCEQLKGGMCFKGIGKEIDKIIPCLSISVFSVFLYTIAGPQIMSFVQRQFIITSIKKMSISG